MKSISSKIFWQTFIASSILLSVLAIYQTVQQVSALDIILWRSKWILLVGIFALNILAGAFGLRQLSLESGKRWVEKLEFIPKNISVKWLGFILVVFGFTLDLGGEIVFLWQHSSPDNTHLLGLSLGKPSSDSRLEINHRAQMAYTVCPNYSCAGINLSNIRTPYHRY